MRVMGFFSCSHGHCGMIESPAKINFVVTNVPQPDKRIVGGHLRVIAVTVRLRQAVQLPAPEAIGAPAMEHFGHVGDVRTPMIVGCSARSKDLQL